MNGVACLSIRWLNPMAKDKSYFTSGVMVPNNHDRSVGNEAIALLH